MSSTNVAGPTYVDPVLNDILNQINFSRNASTNIVNGNDLTLLSAIAYLPIPTVSTDPFSLDTQQQANNSILSSFTLTNPANTNIANAIAKILLNGNTQSYLVAASSAFNAYTPTNTFQFTPFSSGTSVNTSALTVNNIKEAFYQAGSAIFLQLLCARINSSSTTSSTTSSTSSNAYGLTANISPVSLVNPSQSSSTASNAPTFQDVVDLTRYAVALVLGDDLGTNNTILNSRLQQLGLSTTAFKKWAESKAVATLQWEDTQLSSSSTQTMIEEVDMSAISTIAKDAFQYVLSSLNLTNASVINNPETILALLTFGLGPWLVMEYISLYQLASRSFVDQAYSRIATYYAAMVAFSTVSTASSVSSSMSPSVSLSDVVNMINTQLNKSFLSRDYTGPIADVLALSQRNNDVASSLAEQSASLQNRVGIASDLQTTYEYEMKVARTQKITFYAWIVAFILVFVASVTLIMTDRIGIFLPFAYGTLILIAATFALSWLIGFFYQSN